MVKWTLLLVLAALLAYPGIASANGVGNTVEKEIDGFLLEFGVSQTPIPANELVDMSLSLHNITSREALEADVWIRISKGNEILFSSTGFRLTGNSPLFFSFVFPSGGRYTADISVRYGGRDIATDVELDAIGSSEGSDLLLPVVIAAVLIAAALVYYSRR